MTPRQHHAARKRIDKLYAQQARALGPTQKKIDSNRRSLGKKHAALEKKHKKDWAALDKVAHRLQDKLIKKEVSIRAKFRKRIDIEARKLQ